MVKQYEIKDYSMDEPIITFGSESLILEMTPEIKQEVVIEIEPEPIEPIEPIKSKSWCVIS